MPAVGFTKPGSDDGGALSFEDAPKWYDENTEVPEEAIRLVISLEGEPRRRSATLSPSGSSERSTCLRQLCIKKFLPYLMDGVCEWQATEGTIFHDAFERIIPKTEDDWYREVALPDAWIDPDSPLFVSMERVGEMMEQGLIRKDEATGSWQVQVLDGIWMSGRCDKLAKDMSEIQDFKTKAFPGWKDRKTGVWKIRHYPPDKDVKIQLNLYGLMVAKLAQVDVPKMLIRQVYKGTRIAKETWKKYEIDTIPEGELDLAIRPFVDKAVAHFEAMRDIEERHTEAETDPIPELLEYLDNVELTGHKKQMFNGTKCSLYCTQMPICFKQEGLVRFDSKADECRLIKPEEIT